MTEKAKENAQKRKEREDKMFRLDRAITDTCLLILESEYVDLADKMQALQVLRERRYPL